MRFSALVTLMSAVATVAAVPLAVPVKDTQFELVNEVRELFEERFLPDDLDNMKGVLEKRADFSLDGILDLLNSSGIIWSVLDLIAYNPDRIEVLANFTAGLVGNLNMSSLSSLTLGLNLDLNYSLIYNSVMDSGVVTSLLDGILLDEDYRPVLVNLTSRVLEGNKNLFNYLVKDIFKKLKRGLFDKRDTAGTLETFVGNIISSALSSSLVGDIAGEVLVALNDTQFLTYTVKHFLANEGYQNMTGQLVLDIIATGDVKINSQAINITKIADSLLSNPTVVVSLVSNLLSGNVKLPALGKYTSAIGAIVTEVEDNGVFEDLNNYVFSETHSVTQPLIPTNQIVVAKTTLSAKTTTTASSNRTTSRTSSSKTTSTKVSSSSEEDSSLTLGSSAAEVASILSVLRASSGVTVSSSVESAVSSIASSVVSEITDAASSTTSGGFNWLDLLNGASSTTTTTSSSTTTAAAGLLNLLLGGDSSTSANAKRDAVAVTTANGASLAHPDNFLTKVLVAANAVLLGGVLLL